MDPTRPNDLDPETLQKSGEGEPTRLSRDRNLNSPHRHRIFRWTLIGLILTFFFRKDLLAFGYVVLLCFLIGLYVRLWNLDRTPDPQVADYDDKLDATPATRGPKRKPYLRHAILLAILFLLSPVYFAVYLLVKCSLI